MVHSHFAISMFLLLVAFASATDDRYGPSRNNIEKTKLDNGELLSSLIGIQGLVYCQSGTKRTPLEGAVVRITCLNDDEQGYEAAPFSFLSEATNAEGYFFSTLSPYEVQDNRKVKECKAFLELSPLETCKIPTNLNQGLRGSPLPSYQFLDEKRMKLFTVGPFVYTSDSEPNSKSTHY